MDKLPKFPPVTFPPSLPALYGLGLTDYEILVRLIQAINEAIERVNSWSDLAEQLQKYLNELDETVKNKVIEEIEKLYNDGTLKEIIKELANGYMQDLLRVPNKSTYLDFARLFRRYYNVGENNTYVTDPNQYTYAQGCVRFVHNNIEMCAVAYKCSNHSSYRYDNNAIIRVYNMATGQQVASGLSLTVGHANSLAYDDKTGYLYIAWNYTNPTGTSAQQNVKSVSRILVDDLIAGKKDSFLTRSPNHNFNSSATVSCYNGKLYVGQRNNFCEYDFDTNEIKNTIVLSGDDLKGITYIQDMSITQDYIFLLSYLPSKIFMYDKETKKLIWAYNIPDYLNNHEYRSLEPEAITVLDNGDIYLFTGGHTAKKDFNCYDMMQVFKQNIYDNKIAFTNPTASDRPGRNIVLYVDNGFYLSNLNENPNGDENNPFAFIQEALMYAEDCQKISKASIELKSSHGGFTCYVCSSKDIYIYKNADVSGDVYIGGLAVDGATNFTIRDIHLQGHGNNHIELSGQFNLNDYIVCARNCVINIADCILHTGGGTQKGIYVTNVFMNYAGDNATNEDTWNGSGALLTATNSTVNARGKINKGAGSNVIN